VSKCADPFVLCEEGFICPHHEIENLKATIRELVEGMRTLSPFLHHKTGCEFESNAPCDCGLEDAMLEAGRRIAKATKEGRG